VAAFYAVWREARLKARDVSEPAECPPSPPERDALVRRAMLRGVEAVSKINYTTT